MEKSKTRKMQLLLLTLILSIFALGGSLTVALAADMVWDRTLRKMVEAPRYGGTLTFANNGEPPNSDPSIGGLTAGFAITGVLEKLSIADRAIDRSVNNLGNEFLADDHLAPGLAAGWENPDPPHVYLPHPPGGTLAQESPHEWQRIDGRRCRL